MLRLLSPARGTRRRAEREANVGDGGLRQRRDGGTELRESAWSSLPPFDFPSTQPAPPGHSSERVKRSKGCGRGKRPTVRKEHVQFALQLHPRYGSSSLAQLVFGRGGGGGARAATKGTAAGSDPSIHGAEADEALLSGSQPRRCGEQAPAPDGPPCVPLPSVTRVGASA